MTASSNADRSVFFGFGAWIGTLKSLTACEWWPDDPNDPGIKWDRGKLVGVDLDKTPQAARTGRIQRDEIQVDDRAGDGGNTRIGPTWPTGSTINTVYLEATFWEKLPPASRPSRTPKGGDCHDYELTTVLYWSGPLAPRRFWGFYAEITAVKGTMALVTIWPAGRSLVKGQTPEGSYWIDLGLAHPIEPGFTEIGVGPNDPKRGALFLDTGTVGNLHLTMGKHPWWLGSYFSR